LKALKGQMIIITKVQQPYNWNQQKTVVKIYQILMLL